MYYFGSPPADQLSKKIIKMTERSDIRKYSMVNSPIKRDLRFAATGLSGLSVKS
jgi:hypothetical protein